MIGVQDLSISPAFDLSHNFLKAKSRKPTRLASKSTTMKLFNNSVLVSLLVVAFLCVMQASAVETEVERLLGGAKCGKQRTKFACEARGGDACKWCVCEDDYECPNPRKGKHAAEGKCITNDGIEEC